MARAAQELFSLFELAKEGKTDRKYGLTISIYHVYKERIADLLEAAEAKKGTLAVTLLPADQATAAEERTVSGLSEHTMKSAATVFPYLERASTLRKAQDSTEQEGEIAARTHTFVLLRLYVSSTKSKKPGKLLSQLQFVELAGSERAEERDPKDPFRSALSACFSDLSIRLLKHALGEQTDPRDQLQRCLDLSMRLGSPVLMVCCVPPVGPKIVQSVAALGFVDKIRTCIGSARSVPRNEGAAALTEAVPDVEAEREDPPPPRSEAAERQPPAPEVEQMLGTSRFAPPPPPESARELPVSESLLPPPRKTVAAEELSSRLTLSQTASGLGKSVHEAQFEEDLRRVKHRVAEQEREDSARKYTRAERDSASPPPREELPMRYEPENIEPVGRSRVQPAERENYHAGGEKPRRSPEFVQSQHQSLVMSEDARKIVDRYYTQANTSHEDVLGETQQHDAGAESGTRPTRGGEEDEELRKKLDKIESKAKDITKSLKKVVKYSETEGEQMRTAQQYDTVYEELKTTYENHLQEIQQRMEEMARDLDDKTAAVEALQQARSKKSKDCRKKLAAKDEELKILSEHAHSLEETLLGRENSLSELKSEKEQLERETSELKQQLEQKSGVVTEKTEKHSKELDTLNAEVTELRQKLKERKQALGTVDTEKQDMVREIAELRRQIDGKAECERTMREEAKAMRAQIEELRRENEEMKQKVGRFATRKVSEGSHLGRKSTRNRRRRSLRRWRR